MASSFNIFSKYSEIEADDICFRLNCKHLDKTVTGTFCGSVVANINLTCSGGSSNVLSIALNALFESMCTSSII